MKLLLIPGETISKGSDFVVGLPSTGNVGQLATDCVVSTLYAQNAIDRIGSIESSLVLPMIGYESFAANKSEPILCLPIEVYRVKDSNVIIVLQRSLCIKGAQRLFSQKLHQLIVSELGARSAVLLTGANTEDVEPTGSQPLFVIASNGNVTADLTATYPTFASTLDARFASSSVLPPVSTLLASTAHSVGYGEAHNDALLSLEQVQLELAGLSVQGPGYAGQADLAEQGHNSALQAALVSRALGAALPKGMTSVKYFLEAHYSHTTDSANSAAGASAGGAVTSNVVVLGKVCTEGDNIPDGLQLAAQVLDVFALYKPADASAAPVGVTLEQLSHPASWNNKFGRGISGQAVNMFF